VAQISDYVYINRKGAAEKAVGENFGNQKIFRLKKFPFNPLALKALLPWLLQAFQRAMIDLHP
jgi:hypothetical protein